MSLSTICPCGIHRDDCDYHKPVPESEPATLRAAPDSEADTQRSIKHLTGVFNFANDPLTKIAEQISRYRAQRMDQYLTDWAKAYFS